MVYRHVGGSELCVETVINYAYFRMLDLRQCFKRV